MTEVNTPDGKIVTDLPADEVADLQVTPAPAPEPAKEPEPQIPAAEPKAEEPKAPVTPQAEPAKVPEAPKGKAKPIANLLSKLNDERTAREAAEARAAAAEARLNQPPAEPAKPVEPTAQDDIDEIAKKHGITDPSLLKDLANSIRKGFAPTTPGLPKEVQELLAERQQEKEQQAEMAAFDTRAGKLATVFKDEPIAQHKDKLLELAYSTDKAPDGERYCDKELSELYFGYIKPEIEPGKASAEPSRGGSKSGPEVMDFAEIFQRDDPKEVEAMSDKQFAAYNAWMTKTQGDVPIRHAK